jgi:hypothetical protein
MDPLFDGINTGNIGAASFKDYNPIVVKSP